MHVLLEFEAGEIDGKHFRKIFARGRNIEDHKILQVFLQFDNYLYYWAEGGTKLKFEKKIEGTIFPLTEDRFIFINEGFRQIEMVQINFESHTHKVVYFETQTNVTIVNANADMVKDHIIFLTEVILDANSEPVHVLNIFDICEERIIVEITLKTPCILGRFRSGLYQFLDGHIYFDDYVGKIRLDLIKGSIKTRYTEQEMFDMYNNVHHLNENERIMAKSPFISAGYHRLAYVIYDKTQMKPRKLLTIPYLHERKVFLTKERARNNYFYTCFKAEK